MGLYEDLNKLETISGSLDKEAHLRYILQTYKNAETFFRLTFNTMIYKIDEKGFYNAFQYPIKPFAHVSDWLADVYMITTKEPTIIDLETFMNHNLIRLSGNNLLLAINEFFKDISSDKRKWFCRCILKDLRCGVQMKTINHVFIDLGIAPIYKFEMQLCDKIENPYDEKEVNKKIKFPCSAEIKYDGIRCQAEIFQDVNMGHTFCTLTSRRGNSKSVQFIEIVKELEKIFEGQDLILDGEIIGVDFNDVMRKDTGTHKKFIVFDILNDEKLSYKFRWSNLQELFSNVRSDIVQLASHYDINNYQDLIDLYEIAIEEQQEGIIVKDDNAKYERGTRKNWFKLKKVNTADLRIIGYKLGEGKKSGKVATLCLQTEDRLLNVDVGSGINDSMCDYLTELYLNYDSNQYNQPPFMGKIVEIAYNEITLNKNGTHSLRFPRFLRFREDKDNANNFEELKSR